MGKEQKRNFKFVNYTVTESQSSALLRTRERLARGFEPLSISVLLEWFFLRVKHANKDPRLKIELDLIEFCRGFEYPDDPSSQRTGARLDRIVVDWIVATTKQTANTGLSAVLSFMAKSEKKILSDKFWAN